MKYEVKLLLPKDNQLGRFFSRTSLKISGFNKLPENFVKGDYEIEKTQPPLTSVMTGVNFSLSFDLFLQDRYNLSTKRENLVNNLHMQRLRSASASEQPVQSRHFCMGILRALDLSVWKHSRLLSC